MQCYDDITNESLRVDFVNCPMCEAKAEIVYKRISTCNGTGIKLSIDKVNWQSGGKYI